MEIPKNKQITSYSPIILLPIGPGFEPKLCNVPSFMAVNKSHSHLYFLKFPSGNLLYFNCICNNIMRTVLYTQF